MKYRFEGLGPCMWIPLMDGTFMDNTGDILSELLDIGNVNTTTAGIVFVTFVLLSAMTVRYMLVGVLCEVVVKWLSVKTRRRPFGV